MKILKLFKKTFCERIHPSFKFSSIKKEDYCVVKKEKMSIIEYFNIIPRKKTSSPEHAILKELILYVNSDNFKKEFKYSLSNENRVFKFYLLNVSLINNRIEEIKRDYLNELFNSKKYSNILNKIFSINLHQVFLSNICFKFFPLHYIYEGFYNEYTKKYILKDAFQEVFKEKFYRKMKMIDIKYLRYRVSFSKDLNDLNLEIQNYFEEEQHIEKKFEDLLKENSSFKKKYENFLKKYFINFIFEINTLDKSKSKTKGENKLDELSIYEKDIDKLFTYFLAHVKIN